MGGCSFYVYNIAWIGRKFKGVMMKFRECFDDGQEIGIGSIVLV